MPTGSHFLSSRLFRLSGAALLLLALAPRPVALAVEPNLYFHTSAWFANLTGDGDTGNGSNARKFDVDETLGLDTDERVPSFDAFLRVGKSRFILSWNSVTYNGDNRLDDPLEYKGITFPAGGKLRSDMEYDRRRVLYGRPIVDGRRIAVGFLAGIEAYDIESELRMKGTGQATANLDSTVPVVGATFTFFPMPGLRLYAEATGTSFERSNVDSRLLSAYGAAEYSFFGDLLALTAGYRYSFLEGESDNSKRFELRQEGVFAGLAIRL
jgi:hypothetical protein